MATRVAVLLLSSSLGAGCTPGHSVGDVFETEESGDTSTGTTSEDDDGATGTDDAGETGETTDGIFDLPDGTDDPEIPTTCDAAETAKTTLGCDFYAVDLGDLGLNPAMAIAVSNVQTEAVAHVSVQQREGGVWTEWAAQAIPALDLAQFEPPNTNTVATGVQPAHAHRIVSDVPVAVYQINPINGGSDSGDASLLYPKHTWDHVNEAIGWDNGTAPGMVYLSVVAGMDGTEIDVTAGRDLAGGGSIAPTPAGQSTKVTLDDGDMLTMFAQNANESVTGSRITTDPSTPVAVFSGARCVYVPAGNGACDHLEEQLSGLQLWGHRFVAARMPVRVLDDPEDTPWHIYASEDGTTVQFSAEPGITGLPPGEVVLDAGELLELWVTGEIDAPGDFLVEADKPIALLNYMKGSYALPPELDFPGDPAMVQLAPVEQFLPVYVVLVPMGWQNDYLVLTRTTGDPIRLDDVEVPDDQWVSVPGGFEVARVPVEDGVHRLLGDEPFAVEVVGFESTDSYAYLGGAKTELINPEG
jgi:hypothetical protein